MDTLKKYFLILLLAELLFAYAPAFAQTTPAPYDYSQGGTNPVSTQIETFICNPKGTGNGVLYQCINQIYKFSIVLASVIGVFFIVIAGYIYMSAEGNSESVDKAKSIIESTIVSLVILLGGFVFLNTLNPDLVQFHGNTLQPVNLTAPSTTGTSSGGGGSCQAPTVGPATASALAQSCFGTNASNAAMISGKETGGTSNLGSTVDICQDQNGNKISYTGQYSSYSKGYASVSWGLFQINISAHPIVTSNGTSLPCPSAFSSMYTGTNKKCTITNMTLYEQCVGAAIDAATNINNACLISNNGTNWSQWGNECGF
jgi:hypothetical protein